MIKKTLATVTLLASPLLQADTVYTSVEYSATRFETENASWSPRSVIASAGFIVTDWLTIEGRVGKSFDAEDETADQTGLELSHLAGIYTKLSARNEISTISPYLVLGYTQYEVKEEFDGVSYTEDYKDASVGIGLDFRIKENYLFNIEFINYYYKDEVEVDALSFEVGYLF